MVSQPLPATWKCLVRIKLMCVKGVGASVGCVKAKSIAAAVSLRRLSSAALSAEAANASLSAGVTCGSLRSRNESCREGVDGGIE